MTNDAKLNQLFSDYLADKNRQKEYGKKQSALLRKLKSFYSATTLSDTKHCDWLCSVADNLDKQGDARYLADILYVEAYRNIHDMMITEASISDENFAKCKLTLENWGTELDKEDSGSHYTLNQGKEINETIIRFCLEKVDYICSKQNLPDSQYCLLAEKVLNYIVYDADENFLKELMTAGKIFTLFKRLDKNLLVECLLLQRIKVVKANAILIK